MPSSRVPLSKAPQHTLNWKREGKIRLTCSKRRRKESFFLPHFQKILMINYLRLTTLFEIRTLSSSLPLHKSKTAKLRKSFHLHKKRKNFCENKDDLTNVSLVVGRRETSVKATRAVREKERRKDSRGSKKEVIRVFSRQSISWPCPRRQRPTDRPS